MLAGNVGSDSDDETQKALQGFPAIAGLTVTKKVVESQIFKLILSRTIGGILSLVFLSGDSPQQPIYYYSQQEAEEVISNHISSGNLVAMKEYVKQYNKFNDDKIVFRYLSAKEGFFVGKTLKINDTDQNLNITRKYITPDLYGSASTAKSLLALPYAPQLGVWTFESEIQGTKHPQVGWKTVEEANEEPGGGLEGTIGQPFPAKGGFILGK
ncbi:MAG: hypothetical protein JXR03_20815 [Cyclobacteriaceae bacterium]